VVSADERAYLDRRCPGFEIYVQLHTFHLVHLKVLIVGAKITTLKICVNHVFTATENIIVQKLSGVTGITLSEQQ